MNVHISERWQRFIQYEIQSGRFASADQMIEGDRPSFWLHKLSRARKSGPFVSSALAFVPPS
jgi:hypothetical protein